MAESGLSGRDETVLLVIYALYLSRKTFWEAKNNLLIARAKERVETEAEAETRNLIRFYNSSSSSFCEGKRKVATEKSKRKATFIVAAPLPAAASLSPSSPPPCRVDVCFGPVA